MRTIARFMLVGWAVFLVGLFILHQDPVSTPHEADQYFERAPSSASMMAKKARWEHFFNMLRDPATDQIPPNIRQRELAYARSLPKSIDGLAKTDAQASFEWFAVGPTNVGGRTRALAMDVTNPAVMLAGGVSGGMWKSVDGGATWTLKSEPTQNLSVTYLAQDPRPGRTNVWYYTSGEFRGQTAADRGQRALFYGTGLYKSTDSGETWDKLILSSDVNPTAHDSPFDFASKIVVSSTTGSVFVASNGYGIYRSINGGASFEPVLGEEGEVVFSDVAVASNGTLVATLSGEGVYTSTDDGLTWEDVTPPRFPRTPQRSVLAIAPSNPDLVYMLINPGLLLQDIAYFYKIDLASGASEDRTANLPSFANFGGRIVTQDSYNMVLAVKPDDEDFVIVGGTSLFRSRDGFRTPARDKADVWIGGYDPESSSFEAYPGHHPDQHVVCFDPQNPNRVWSGHDGGISVTPDIAAPQVAWELRNEGYITTQFYTVAISNSAGDTRILGGAQDNATPYLRWQPAQDNPSINVGTGDGGHAYLGQRHAYVSGQSGFLLRLNYDEALNPLPGQGARLVSPPGTQGRLFIHPFAVDPGNEDVMYYPFGHVLWRHADISSEPLPQDSLRGWEALSAIRAPDTAYDITALEVSHSPPHVLYFGASRLNRPPLLYRLERADVARDGEVSRSIPGAPEGAYLHDIAVNPDEADEILVVLSNYNISGLYHSVDGGQSLESVEGNLIGSEEYPGPSLRSAAILPTAEGPVYLVGMSTGLYATTQLDGANTRWVQQAPDMIGNVVVEHVTARRSDSRVAVATHGRGLFVGSLSERESDPSTAAPVQFSLAQNYPNPFRAQTNIRFSLDQPGIVTLSVYDLGGRKVKDLLSERQLESGRYEWPFEIVGLASGTYLYKMEVGSLADPGLISSRVRTMILLK